MNTKSISNLSKSDERKMLAAQSERIRKNPEIGVEIAKKAGILDKNGRLTAYYKIKA